jgi:hypothetical protein
MQKIHNYTIEDALCVHFIFNNSVAFNDYFVPQAWRGKRYITRYYQYPIVLSDDALAIKVCKIFGVKFATAIHFLIGEGLDKSLTMAKLKLLKKYGRYSADIIKDAEERIRKG